MSERTVYSIAKTLQNTTALEEYLSQMLSVFRDTIEKDYLLKIRSAADREKAFAMEHPPREVTLLRAMSAFADENGKQQIRRMTQSLLFVHTLQQIRQSVETLGQNDTLLAARSADGSMDSDPPSVQSARMAGLMLALALAERF